MNSSLKPGSNLLLLLSTILVFSSQLLPCSSLASSNKQQLQTKLSPSSPPPLDKTKMTNKRPQLVLDAINKNETLYCFAFGSNMLKSKLKYARQSEPVRFLSMEPAIVPNYRLSFCMRSFPPLEPGMATLEPTTHDDDEAFGKKSIKPLYKYKKDECHGALIHLTAEMYERVMRSEGVGPNSKVKGGYQEIIVQAYPYKDRNKAITAISLRANAKTSLSIDTSPSIRYMTLLRDGAAELGLEKSYQDFLAQHPTEYVPSWLQSLALSNWIFTGAVIEATNSKLLNNIQKWLLYKVYVPTPQNMTLQRRLSELAMGAIFFPCAMFGALMKAYYKHVKGGQYPSYFDKALNFTDKVENVLKNKKTSVVGSGPNAKLVSAMKINGDSSSNSAKIE